jgi:hypothetical protein
MMKKIILLISLFYLPFFISNNINAAENKLLKEYDKIEFNKCYNYQITSEKINCSNEKIFLTLGSLDKKYFCSQIPFIKEEKLRGNRITSLPIDYALLKHYVCDVWFERFWRGSDCTNKYGAKRRQKCFDDNNIILFKPSKPLSYKYCVNNFKKLITNIVSIDNKQNCSLLKKYDSSWEEDYKMVYEQTHKYISYWDYVKNTSLHNNNIIVEEKRERIFCVKGTSNAKKFRTHFLDEGDCTYDKFQNKINDDGYEREDGTQYCTANREYAISKHLSIRTAFREICGEILNKINKSAIIEEEQEIKSLNPISRPEF